MPQALVYLGLCHALVVDASCVPSGRDHTLSVRCVTGDDSYELPIGSVVVWPVTAVHCCAKLRYRTLLSTFYRRFSNSC